MTRGRRSTCPPIVLIPAKVLRYASRAQAWAAAGPVLARILAKAIGTDGPPPRSRRSGSQRSRPND